MAVVRNNVGWMKVASIGMILFAVVELAVVNVNLFAPPGGQAFDSSITSTNTARTATLDPSTKEAHQILQNELGEAPLYTSLIDNPWKKDLFQRLDRIRARCGALCTINDQTSLEKYTIPNAGIDFRQLSVPVDCKTIMLDEEIDIGDSTVPYPPPDELLPYYSMNGLVDFVLHKKHEQVYLEGNNTWEPVVWTEDYLNTFITVQDATHARVNYKPYGRDAQKLRDTIFQYIEMKGKRVLVIGTEVPWVEAICLNLGAAHVTTLEFGTIANQHPRISTYTPAQFRELYRTKQLDLFDVVVTFSSLEHPGLGRYGDSLNPWGDTLSVAKARCVTKSGGYLAIGVPTGTDKVSDKISFNADRTYWKHRYPLLTANWEQISKESLPMRPSQPIFIFRNVGVG